MRFVSLLAIGLACSAVGVDLACADSAPVLVIPGRADVPVVINGYDASYTVVEGDWGLSRPGHMPPAIVSGPLLAPAPYYSGAYYPKQGRRPGYGRREVEPPPNRRLPPPAPSYYREWGVQSQPSPATIPEDPPPVISASPQDGYGDGNEHPGYGANSQQDRQTDRRQDRRDDRHDARDQNDRRRTHHPPNRHHPSHPKRRRVSAHTRRP